PPRPSPRFGAGRSLPWPGRSNAFAPPPRRRKGSDPPWLLKNGESRPRAPAHLPRHPQRNWTQGQSGYPECNPVPDPTRAALVSEAAPPDESRARSERSRNQDPPWPGEPFHKEPGFADCLPGRRLAGFPGTAEPPGSGLGQTLSVRLPSPPSQSVETCQP